MNNDLRPFVGLPQEDRTSIPLWTRKDIGNKVYFTNRNNGASGYFFEKDTGKWYMDTANRGPSGSITEVVAPSWAPDDLKKIIPKPDPYTPPTPPTPDPYTPPQPDPMQQYLEEMRRQQEEAVRQMQAEQAKREAEAAAAAKAAAEAKAARMTDRKGALEQSGLWNVVEQMYGQNQADIDSYLDTGVFSRRDNLNEWANNNLIPLSQDLQQQYAKGISDIQQRAAAQGMGDASWLRGVEGALRQQQRALADNYGSTYDPNKLYSILSGSPSAIRDFSYSAPQKVSDFGKGITGFTMLDPTLSQMVPGGIDETPMPWLKSDYQKKNPWAEIFGDTSETSLYNPAQGFLKGILGG